MTIFIAMFLGYRPPPVARGTTGVSGASRHARPCDGVGAPLSRLVPNIRHGKAQGRPGVAGPSAAEMWQRQGFLPNILGIGRGRPGAPRTVQRRQADEAFLRGRGDEPPGASTRSPARSPRLPAGARAVLGIEQPVVGPQRPVEPERVVRLRPGSRRRTPNGRGPPAPCRAA